MGKQREDNEYKFSLNLESMLNVSKKVFDVGLWAPEYIVRNTCSGISFGVRKFYEYSEGIFAFAIILGIPLAFSLNKTEVEKRVHPSAEVNVNDNYIGTNRPSFYEGLNK